MSKHNGLTTNGVKRRRLLIALNKQNYRCYYCSVPINLGVIINIEPGDLEMWQETTPKLEIATIDHLLPQAAGGTNLQSNVVAACRPCNNKRHDNPQCYDGKRLLQNGQVIAYAVEGYWRYLDLTRAPKRIRHLAAHKVEKYFNRPPPVEDSDE